MIFEGASKTKGIKEKEENKMNKRIQQLRELIKNEKLDAILIGSEANRRYLSGFTGSNAMLYISLNQTILVTDFRYLEQVAKEAPDFICVDQGQKGLLATTVACAQEEGIKRIGFEAQHVSYSQYLELSQHTAFEWVPTTKIVEGLRQIKDEEEIEKLRKAEAIGDLAFKEVIPFIKANWEKGLTENEIALHLEQSMRRHGASGLSFSSIVATGAKSSLPHAQPGEEKLQKGDFVVMDFGCIYEGYCSDMTRTIVIGEASKKHLEIYETVLRAQKAALEGIRPGMKGASVDAIARDIIKEAGYGAYFGHGLGHAVGLEIHENPRFSMLEQTEIKPGMVLTVEPGIYLPGFGGVRIEDMVVITEEGIDNLTHSPKDLIIIQ